MNAGPRPAHRPLRNPFPPLPWSGLRGYHKASVHRRPFATPGAPRGAADAVWALVALAALLVASPRVKASGPTHDDEVLATELFREGRAEMGDARYATACPKLEESERLDPGGGTLLNLALCHELEGRTATAWSEFHAALAVARDDAREDREQQAQRHIDALEPRLLRLSILVPIDAQVPELAVSRDQTPLEPAAWGAAIPIDPGRHVIHADAPGHESWEAVIDMPLGAATQAVSIPRLRASPVQPMPSETGSEPAQPSREALQVAPEAPPSPVHRTAHATAAWLTAGAAVLALSSSIAFTLYEADRSEHYNDDAECGNLPGLPRSQRCASTASQFRVGQTGAIASYVITGAATVASSVLFLSLPSRRLQVVAGGCQPLLGGVACAWTF